MKAKTAHRAVFGERNNAHELLAASGAQELFRRFPAIEADLPSDAPVGLKWEPFLRGWPAGEFYFFSRTAPDLAAKRAGMVSTQILAISLTEMPALEELGPIFTELSTAWHLDGPLAPFEFTPSEKTGGSRITQPSPRLVAVADFLGAGASAATPVVISGQEGFADLIQDLWRRMPRAFRSEMAFGFSFTPTDLLHRRLNIVCSPIAVVDRWRAYAWRVDQNPGQKAISPATAFILATSPGESLRDFSEQAGLPDPSLTTLPMYVRAADYWAKRTQLDFDGWCALAKDIGSLAPDALQGAIMKLETTAAVARLLESGGANGVLSLRNLNVIALGKGAESIGLAVKLWIFNQFQLLDKSVHEGLLEVIRGVARPASMDWSAWIKDGFIDTFAKATEVVAKNCWGLWQRDEAVFHFLADRIPRHPEAEVHWSRTVPQKLTESLGQAVTAWCLGRRWWICYAKVLLAWNDWEVAAREYFATDLDQTRVEPVRLLLASIAPANAVAFAANNHDTRLRGCGADICILHPEVFIRFDGRSEGWRDLLRRALVTGPSLLERLVNGQAVLFAVLDWVIESNEMDTESLSKFVGSGMADLADYPQCDKIFDLLSGNLRGAFLAATAKGWLDRYLRKPGFRPQLPPFLRIELISGSLRGRRFSPQQAGLVPGGVALLKEFVEVPEELFLEWLEAVAASDQYLTDGQAAELALLLKEKAWETAAWRVKHLAAKLGRADLGSLWSKYWMSFSWQEKLIMRISGPTVESGKARSFSQVPPIISGGKATREKRALFVTALNLEFMEVQAHLVEIKEITVNEVVYAAGIFTHQSQFCEVIVALAGMGNVEASLATERAIAQFEPDYAFFMGIAGALKEELKLGDVVAADKIYAYESGKAQKEFRSRPKAPSVSFAAIQLAGAVVRGKKWLIRIKPPPASEPKAYVKAIAAGEKVIDSHESEVYALLKKNYGDAYAVAMEEFGFATAAHAHPSVTFAVVRGISDAAQDKGQAEMKNSQEIAARHAAAFAFEMLAGFLDSKNSNPPERLDRRPH